MLKKNLLAKLPTLGYFHIRNIGYEARNHLQTGARISVTRKITKEDIRSFCELTNDFNPIHTNPEKPMVHGAFLNGLLSGVLGTRLPGPGTIVLEQNLRYTNPCYAGDRVTITVEVLSVRKIIKCGWKLQVNGGRTVLEGEGKFVLTKIDVSGVQKNEKQEVTSEQFDK